MFEAAVTEKTHRPENIISAMDTVTSGYVNRSLKNVQIWPRRNLASMKIAINHKPITGL
jgi:hypothetical protein